MTEQQLLDAARRQGCKVSADQLKRWRRADLIPRPVQTHRAGNQGSEATYPPGTLTQLLAVCELRKRFKKLDRIRFELWWSGDYKGETGKIRAFLIAQLDGLLEELRELRDRFDDPADAAEAAVSGAVLDPRHPGLRAMRRLANDEEDMRSAMYAMFLDLFGGDVPWDHDTTTGLMTLVDLFGASVISEVGALEPSLRILLERVTGMERAKTDSLDSGTPILSADANMVEAIQTIRIQRLFDLDDPGWAIRKSSDEELEAARGKARLLGEGFSMLARISAVRFGRDHGGLSLLAALDPQNPTFAAVMVQWGLLLPSLISTEEEGVSVRENLDALAANDTKLACTELLLSELPEYRFLLKRDGKERLASLTYEERAVVANKVNGFLMRHPECSQLLDPKE